MPTSPGNSQRFVRTEKGCVQLKNKEEKKKAENSA